MSRSFEHPSGSHGPRGVSHHVQPQTNRITTVPCYLTGEGDWLTNPLNPVDRWARLIHAPWALESIDEDATTCIARCKQDTQCVAAQVTIFGTQNHGGVLTAVLFSAQQRLGAPTSELCSLCCEPLCEPCICAHGICAGCERAQLELRHLSSVRILNWDETAGMM
jgi:hypothetical protein